MPEIELMRAHELAQAAQNARWLFWIVIGGTLALAAFWSLVRWRKARRAAKGRRALLGIEVRRHADKNLLYDEIAWREFCDRNELSQSTRDALTAGVRERI